MKLLTNKEYDCLRSLNESRTSINYTFAKENVYNRLESQGYIWVYYLHGKWYADVTSVGIKALYTRKNINDFVKVACIMIAVILTGALLCSCTSTKEVSTLNTQHSALNTQHSAVERKDSIVYRDSISYVERTINDTVYITKEATRWRIREKLVYDTLQVLKTDSVYVYRDVEKVVEKQPSMWHRISDGMFWLLIGCALFLACRTLIKLIRR